METFLKIDWNPSLEDIVDDVFINEERLVRESVMYKLLRGNFTNPFDNMDEDYKVIKADLVMDKLNSTEGTKKKMVVNNSIKNDQEDESKDKKNNYVPGIVKPPCKFPVMSDLSKAEHAICLKILLKFSGSEKPDLNDEDREHLQTYLRLKETINEEQDQYSEFVKQKWDGNSLKIYCEDYINARWKYKLQNILKLPRYYVEFQNIPFVSKKEVTVQFISTCLEKGYPSSIKLPNFTRPYMLRVNSAELEEQFPIVNECSEQSSIMHSKLPVSKDPTCESLAEANEVDLVISSSGLNCLANNIGPNYAKTWILPITVKSHNGKSVIYIDKPAPPTYSTVPEKNTWVFKYILRHAMVQLKSLVSKRPCKPKVYDENLFGNIHSEDHIKLEDEYPAKLDALNNRSVKQDTEDENADEVNALTGSESGDEHMYKEGQLNDDDKSNYENYVSYKLFKIGPSSVDESELMKNTIKDYKILVRTKEDGHEKLTRTTQQKLLLAPKLEHQIAFGAEAVTLDEALKQWTSLMFRPGTCLARVRISAQTTEVIQIEKRTTMSINNEIKRLYNVKVENSLMVLHNVIQTLSNITPGNYIMRHTVRNGAFATVYKETDNTGKNVLDLHTIYGYHQFQTIPNPPWPMLDKVVITPMHKCFQRMPLMFYPPKVSNKRKFKKKLKLSTNSKN